MGQADVTVAFAVRQCGSLQPNVNVHLVATTSDSHVVPISGWMSTLGVVAVEGTFVITGVTGAISVKLTYRTATTSPEQPDAWNTTGLGSAYTSATEDNTGELTPTTTDKALIQFGLLFSTSSTFGQADVLVALGLRSSS